MEKTFVEFPKRRESHKLGKLEAAVAASSFPLSHSTATMVKKGENKIIKRKIFAVDKAVHR